MAQTAWNAYGQLVNSGSVEDLVSPAALKFQSASLAGGTTEDFTHFWFYSFLAAAVSTLAGMAGIDPGAHSSFIALHWALLLGLFLVAWWCYRWKGVAAIAALALLSPSIWYFDKVHTEWFTFCLTTAAVILFARRRYMPAALSLALASTQNVSFGAVSLVVLGIHLVGRREAGWSLSEVAAASATVGLAALSPTYYFFRLGTWSPFLPAGAGQVGAHAKWFWIYLLDPDVGLVPNWPFGVLVLGLCLGSLWSRRHSRGEVARWGIFIACYVAFSGLAQTSNLDLNSGATPGFSRYALWYVALWFPLILLLLDKASASRLFGVLGASAAMIGCITTATYYAPWFVGTYTSPTVASNLVQSRAPSLYNPPPEIFAERYGAVPDGVNLSGSAVLGPDCHKVLVVNAAAQGERSILGGGNCAVIRQRVSRIISDNLRKGTWRAVNGATYERLSDSELQQAMFLPRPGEWYAVTSGKDIAVVLLDGWQAPEDAGAWTSGPRADIRFLCPVYQPQDGSSRVLELEMVPLAAADHREVPLRITSGRALLWSGSLATLETLDAALPDRLCKSGQPISVSFFVQQPASGSDGGLPADNAAPVVGLLRMRILEGKK